MADYTSSLTGQMMDIALTDMAQHNSEAWAVGERNGIPVASDDETYNNNSKYWATIAGDMVEGTGITDPNDDGNLVVSLPSSDSESWAVRTDVAQTLSETQKSQARANISAGASNRNLLMNPFFTVNQRGAASYTASATTQTVDRWTLGLNSLGTGTLTVETNGVTIANGYASGSAYFVQRLDTDLRKAIDGKTVTLSVLYQDGSVKSGSGEFHLGTTSYLLTGDSEIALRIYSPNTDRAEPTVDILASKTISIRAVKLEIGEYSTIVNDTLPDYGEELVKCQYYYRRYHTGSNTAALIASGYAFSSTVARFHLDGIMRSASSASAWMNGSISVIGASGEHTVTAITTTWTVENDHNGAVIFLTTTGLTSYEPLVLRLGNNATITYSVEL